MCARWIQSPIQNRGSIIGGIEFPARGGGAERGDRIATGQCDCRQVLAQYRVGGGVGEPGVQCFRGGIELSESVWAEGMFGGEADRVEIDIDRAADPAVGIERVP